MFKLCLCVLLYVVRVVTVGVHVCSEVVDTVKDRNSLRVVHISEFYTTI